MFKLSNLRANNSNTERYATVLKSLTVVCVSVFLLLLISLYSPHADSFSLRSSLFSVFIISALISLFLFVFGTVIMGIALFPKNILKKHSVSDTSFDTEKEESRPYPWDDWYNHDVANPASPIYQVVHRSLHHEN